MGENFWPLSVDSQEGERRSREMLGPFIERYSAPDQDWTAARPLWIRYDEHAPLNPRSLYVLYPLFSYRATDPGYYWNVFYLIRGSEYRTGGEVESEDFEIFPFYFDHENHRVPELSYRGFLPFHGEVKGRLFQDRIFWTLFPLYTGWENNGETTYGTPWPFVRYRTGNGSGGFALWPLFGGFERPGHYRYRYLLWPLIYDRESGLDREEPLRQHGFLPFYTYDEGPGGMVSESFLWPFFGYTDREEPYYRETRYFWPFLVQGRGTPYVNRWGPFYTHSIRNGVDKKWFLWPLLKRKAFDTPRLHVRTWSFLYVLYWSQKQTALDESADFEASKTFVWPLFSHWDGGRGEEQFQLLAPLAPWFKHNEVVRDLYSPLFALYRYQGDEASATWRRDFLFNLITVEKQESGRRLTLGPLLDVRTGGDEGGFSVLHGLFGRGREKGETHWRLFWFKL